MSNEKHNITLLNAFNNDDWSELLSRESGTCTIRRNDVQLREQVSAVLDHIMTASVSFSLWAPGCKDSGFEPLYATSATQGNFMQNVPAITIVYRYSYSKTSLA